MKKTYTLFLLLAFVSVSFAQQINNGGFESWTGGIPDGWSTTKTIVANTNLETKDTIAAYQGSSAIKIVTGHAGSPIDTLSGFAHYGPATSGYYANEYIPFTCHPDSIRFAYKYTSVGGDHGALSVYFAYHHGDIFFIDGYYLTSAPTYQVLTLPFYNGGWPGYPDSLSLTFYSSFDLAPNVAYHAGSTLWVDGVSFIYNNGPNCSNTSAIEQIGADQAVKLSPNPANQHILITANANAVGAQIKMYDRIGREVYSGSMDGAAHTISTVDIESGYYMVRVCGTAGNTLYMGNVAVIH